MEYENKKQSNNSETNRKIKILFLITGLNMGGAEIMIENITENINKNKFDICVVSIAPIGEIGQRIKEKGICVKSASMKSKLNIFALFRLYKIIKAGNYDIINSHLFHANILGRIIGYLCKTPVNISTIHSIKVGGKLREFILKKTDDLSTFNTAVGEKVKENILKKGLSKSSKVKLIPNGINIRKFRENKEENKREKLKLPLDKKIIISVGRLTKAKGYEKFFEALAGIKKEGWDFKYIILGEGPERNKLEEKINELDLKHNIALLGIKENVPEYLQTADIFAMPSLWEGFSISLLEAAVSKLPLLVSPVGGNTEIVKDGETGFLAEPGNTNSWQKALKKILSLNQEELQEIGKRAQALVKEKYSLEKMVNEYENLFIETYNQTNKK
jgi:glycosyltransferase involved in cell wall biosynthesis